MPEQRSPELSDAQTRVRTHSVRRIGRIAQHMGARSYLEIGVCRGQTFHHVQFDRKVAVDPRFRFEVGDFQRDGVEFHAVCSDAYFTTKAGSQKFDIVFLDGLHTFQQTFRDFCNSLACAHERTIWLIDDVLPVDIYSAWPVESEAIACRKKSGVESSAWHGDVYKVVFAIHDFFPMFSYVTIIGSGNPQTLVWKAPRSDFSPLLNSMEAIERMGYFDLLRRMAILNAKAEDAAFRDMVSSIFEEKQPARGPSDRGRRWMRWRGVK